MYDESLFFKHFKIDDVEGVVGLAENKVLIAAINDWIDLKEVASWELANRGLDGSGLWVGFKEAKRLHVERGFKIRSKF